MLLKSIVFAKKTIKIIVPSCSLCDCSAVAFSRISLLFFLSFFHPSFSFLFSFCPGHRLLNSQFAVHVLTTVFDKATG